jgi:hypothetical protein
MHLMIKVVKPFGFYIDEHQVGEEFSVPLGSVEELIKEGVATIVVNNMGNNLPYDEKDYEPWEQIIEAAQPVMPVPEEEEKPLTINSVREKLGFEPLEVAPKRKAREPFWNEQSNCIDCGGKVSYWHPMNRIACDTCSNEITEWM